MPADKDKTKRAPLEASDENEDMRAEAAELDEGTEVEPTSTTTEIEFDGATWTVDTDGDGWPLDASIAFAKILNCPDDQPARSVEYIADFLEAVLGGAQWARFRRGRRTRDLRPMFDAVFDQAFRPGASAGE